MVRRYGQKGKCWSTYLKRCLEKDSLSFHTSVGVYDADKQEDVGKLTRAVDEHLAVRFESKLQLSLQTQAHLALTILQCRRQILYLAVHAPRVNDQVSIHFHSNNL